MKLLALTALAGAVSAWSHNSSRDFAGCYTCKCGDDVCQHHESDCIFEHLTNDKPELTRKEALEDLEIYLSRHYTLDHAQLKGEAEKGVEALFGSRSEVDQTEFYDIYMAIRDKVVCTPGVINVGDVWHANQKGYCIQWNEYGHFKW